MRLVKRVCPTKFRYVRRVLSAPAPRILDIGCGNNSPSTTKHWFPDCHYSGVDIQQYNNDDDDTAAMDAFYPVGVDGSGYSAIPNDIFDFVILHHVIEHMSAPAPILSGMFYTLARRLYLDRISFCA
jgi:2-polyprenyl-3-methyl-5-hydroxy-6-metoxy-1,4-benzoquinol methylase